jgi:hypothetical protein
MPLIRSVAAIVAVVVAFAAANGAHGQIMSERLAELPRFAEVRADLDAAGVSIAPNTLVDRYAEFVGAWCAEQSQIRAALARTLGTQPDVIPSVEETDRAVAAIRRARAAHESRLDRFATRIAEAVPEDARPKLEAVRGWWRIRAARPGDSLWGFARADDVGDLVRRHPIPPDARAAVMTALDGSATARRDAFRRFDRAVGAAAIAAARLAASEGQSGTTLELNSESEPRQEFLNRYYAAGRPDPAAMAAVFDSQLAAFDAVAPRLPGSARRAVFDEIVRQHMGDQMRGDALRLPSLGPGNVPLQAPAEVGQLVIAWKGLPESARDDVRKAMVVWLAEDDKAVRDFFATRSETMRGGSYPPSFQIPRHVQQERGAVAKRHMQALAELAGAAWLVDGSAESIERDSARITDADREIMGPTGFGVRASASAASSSPRTRRFLPALPPPADPWSAERTLVDPLVERTPSDARDGVRAILDDLLAARVEAWQRLVEPRCLEAEAADLASRTGTEPERLAAMAKAADARLAAFDASASADRDLIQSIEAAVAGDHAAFLAAWFASQRFREGVQGIEFDKVLSTGMDLERLGGALIDLGQLASSLAVPLPVRLALERELEAEWPRLADAAIATLRTRIEAEMLWRQVADPTIEDPTIHARRDALVTALRQAADAWRAEENVLVPRLQAAADASAPLLAVPLREARFPSACAPYVRARALRKAVDDLPEFPARASLQTSLQAIDAQLVDFAERSIALTIPRRTIADLSDDERWRIDEGRAWRRRDLMAGSGQLGDAMNWLVAKLVPPEMAATSPVLEVAVRVGTR